jgi:hypothetical protein
MRRKRPIRRPARRRACTFSWRRTARLTACGRRNTASSCSAIRGASRCSGPDARPRRDLDEEEVAVHARAAGVALEDRDRRSRARGHGRRGRRGFGRRADRSRRRRPHRLQRRAGARRRRDRRKPAQTVAACAPLRALGQRKRRATRALPRARRPGAARDALRGEATSARCGGSIGVGRLRPERTGGH